MDKIKIAAYEIPCNSPKSDGTLEWKTTILILIALQLENKTGLGFSYAHEASLDIIKKTFQPFLREACPATFPLIYQKMLSSVRNIGRSGVAAHAISAVDIHIHSLNKSLQLLF